MQVSPPDNGLAGQPGTLETMKLARMIRMRALIAAAVLFGKEAYTPAAEDRTLTVSESDLRTAAILKIEPDYPAVARQIRLTGSVDLEVFVDETGTVEKASVVRGNTLLTGPSLQAIRKWKFKPFGAGGGPAKAAGPIRFTFQM